MASRSIPWPTATDIQYAIQYATPTIDTATYGTSRTVSTDASDAPTIAIPIVPRNSSADAIDAATSIMAIESVKPGTVQSTPSMSV